MVSPGYIRTAFNRSRRGRLPGPDLIARAIAGLVERPRREVVAPWWYGGAIAVERVAPWLVDFALRR